MESQIADYVHRSLDKGHSIDQIKKRLIHAGWTEDQLNKMPVFQGRETKLIQQITDIEKNFEEYKVKYEDERKRLNQALAEIDENRRSLEKKHEAYNTELTEIEKIKDRLKQKETELERREKDLISKEESISHKDRHLQGLHDSIQKRATQLEMMEKDLEHRSAIMISEKLELIRNFKNEHIKKGLPLPPMLKKKVPSKTKKAVKITLKKVNKPAKIVSRKKGTKAARRKK